MVVGWMIVVFFGVRVCLFCVWSLRWGIGFFVVLLMRIMCVLFDVK